MTDFSSLGLDARLLRAVSDAGLSTPTPIQAKAIPVALKGRDVLGLAQTGTGKTAAFGLPLVQALMAQPHRPQPKTIKALVLAPTRELVNQIAEALAPFTRGSRISVGRVVGGQSLNRQITMLNKGLDLLVATPGRLIDLMERRAVRLDTAKFLVLDEADQMLDMGFIHALRKIAPALGTPRQTMLFSATMPREMEGLAAQYLHDPVRVQVSPPGKAADKVEQCLHFVPQAEKGETLKAMLAADPGVRSLVFSRTKHGAERLMKDLVRAGFDAASIHGNKSQGQRDRAIAGFRDGSVAILVATDVAARGIDIPDVAYVFNYDLPNVPDQYVHRIGRTARAGREGRAISFVDATEMGYLKDIEKVMGIAIPVAGGERPVPVAPAKPGKRGGGGGGGRRGQQQPKGRPASKGKRPAKAGAKPAAAQAPKPQAAPGGGKPKRQKRERVRQRAA